MQKVKKGMDLFGDKNGPSIIMEFDIYRDNYKAVKRRGARIRLITEVTGDNIHYCKELTSLHRGRLMTQVFYSNAIEVVKQGQYVFNTFWNKAIPAKQRIRETEFIENYSGS
jgi:hypothetical protein